jgi:hypothetical protein
MLKDDLKTLGLYDKVKNYGDAMNMIWLDRGADKSTALSTSLSMC